MGGMSVKKIISLLLCAAALTGCAGLNGKNAVRTNDKTIKVAVFQNSGEKQENFEKGIELAYEDVLQEYKDSGYKIECDFYDNLETYEDVQRITDTLVADPSVTAIIGSDTDSICENQAVKAQNNGKLFICPMWVNDEAMLPSQDMVFSMLYSNYDMSRALKKTVDDMPDMRWAVCVSNDGICSNEAQSFRMQDAQNVVDYCDMNDLRLYFDRITDRWRNLGVGGVVFLPYSERYFDLFRKLKTYMPELYFVCDFDMDMPQMYEGNEAAYKNVYLVDGFYVDGDADDIKRLYEESHVIDTWTVHGYNTLRMIVDTAVRNGTNDPKRIASILHDTGYDGAGQTFKFDSSGLIEPVKFSYSAIDSLEAVLMDARSEVVGK